LANFRDNLGEFWDTVEFLRILLQTGF